MNRLKKRLQIRATAVESKLHCTKFAQQLDTIFSPVGFTHDGHYNTQGTNIN